MAHEFDITLLENAPVFYQVFVCMCDIFIMIVNGV